MTNLSAREMRIYINSAKSEAEREIYSIQYDNEDIIVNYDWSTERDKKVSLKQDIISALEAYCTQSNIEWEYSTTYSAWCD